MNPPLKRVLAVLATLVALLGLGIAVHDSPGPHPGKYKTLTVTLGGQGHKQVMLPPKARAIAKTQAQQAAAGHEQAAHANLRAEPPAANLATTIATNQALAAELGQAAPPPTIPLASVYERGCRTLPVRNYSLRTGSPSLLIVLHQTISPDDGWNGVLGNVRWFDSAPAQASSDYIVARTGGQCAYIVPEAEKAWAQAGFNSVTPCSIEVTETGKEGSYLVGAGFKKVVQIVHDCAMRWHIPLQHGEVSGCNVIRPGVVEHVDLGQCGGGHFDDTPYSIAPVIAAARKLGAPKRSKHATWAAHRRGVHRTYVAKCHTRKQRAANAKECAALRMRGRELDHLIGRNS